AAIYALRRLGRARLRRILRRLLLGGHGGSSAPRDPPRHREGPGRKRGSLAAADDLPKLRRARVEHDLEFAPAYVRVVEDSEHALGLDVAGQDARVETEVAIPFAEPLGLVPVERPRQADQTADL